MSKDYVMQLESTIENLRRDNALLKEQTANHKKVLKTLQEKRVNIDLFWNDFVDNGFGYHYYLERWYKYQSTDKQKLTEEEFEVLKRWLE